MSQHKTGRSGGFVATSLITCVFLVTYIAILLSNSKGLIHVYGDPVVPDVDPPSSFWASLSRFYRQLALGPQAHYLPQPRALPILRTLPLPLKKNATLRVQQKPKPVVRAVPETKTVLVKCKPSGVVDKFPQNAIIHPQNTLPQPCPSLGKPESGKFAESDRGSFLWHWWSDEELSQKALAVKDPPADSKDPMKIAFLFLVRGDITLYKLWERYLKGQEGKYSLYVHASDPFFRMSRQRRLFWGRQIPSGEVSRFHFSMVDAEIRLYANAMLDPLNKHFILVSEACVPIRPFPALYEYLSGTDKSHVESYVMQSGRVRKNPMWRRRMQPQVPAEKFRKGSQWKEMHRRHVRWVVSDKTFWEPIKWKWLTPDEHYIPSLFVLLGKENETTGQSLTHVDWNYRLDSHPRQYSKDEVNPYLISMLQQASPTTFFARKFGVESLKIILEMLNIEGNVLGY